MAKMAVADGVAVSDAAQDEAVVPGAVPSLARHHLSTAAADCRADGHLPAVYVTPLET